VGDERLLNPGEKYFFGLLGIINEVKLPPSGFFLDDIEHYTYKFYKGENIYEVSVECRGIIQYNNKYYRVDPDIHNLGKAFARPPKYVSYNNALNKIAESGGNMSSPGLSSNLFACAV